MQKALFYLTALCLFIACPAHAQRSSGGQKSYKVRLLAFDSNLNLNEVYIHDPAAIDPEEPGTKAQVKTYLNHESEVISLRSPKLMIGSEASRDSLKKEGGILAEATFPKNTRQAILLILPNTEGAKTKYRVMVVNDSARAFPAGSHHITNLSPLRVKILLEKQEFDFPPGKQILIKDPPVRTNQMTGMRCFAMKDGKWMPVSTGLWPNPGRARGFKVMFINPANGLVQLRAYDDVPPSDFKPTE